ncbi:MAG: M1 family aminopeptidase [Planctomycetota bacterium]
MTALRLALFAALMASAPSAQDPVPGVARDLAQARKARIGELTYRLRFDLSANEPMVRGFAQIAFELKDQDTPKGAVVLDFAGAELSISSINGRVPDQEVRRVADHVVIPSSMLVCGTNLLEADFRSNVAATGTPLTRYVDPTDQASYLYTLLVPADAHGLFPCFDQPDLKACFRLTLTLPVDWIAVGNTEGDVDPAVEALADPADETARNRKVLSFRPTHLLPTYLFAFAAGPFATIDDTVPAGLTPDPNRPLRMVLRRSQIGSVEAPRLFELHRNALQRLGEWFATPYPFEKLDFVLIPGFPYGGMEHAGAIFYRDTALAFERKATEPEEVRRSTLIYHEVSHQWFGNLVTMVWFDDLWLKEGFATFLAYQLLDELEPARQSWLRFLQRVKMRAYAVDETPGTTPIWQELGNLADAKSAYGAIVYNKAPAVLRELEARLGREPFRNAVRHFVQDHAFGNATWQDLVSALKSFGGLEGDAWSNRWILGKGLPKVRLEWATGKDGRIASCRLVQQGPESSAGSTDPWPLAVRIRVHPQGGDPCELQLRSDALSIDVPDLVGMDAPLAFLLNPGDVAYGSFRLDPISANWFAGHIETVTEPLARVEATTQLLLGTRDLELPPMAMADALLALIDAEHDADTHEWLLGRLAETLGRQLVGTARDRRVAQAERLAIMQLDEDRPGSKLPLVLFLATTCNSARVDSLLRAILDGSRKVTGLELAPRDRFTIAAALLAHGDKEAVAREEQRNRDAGDVAKWAFVAGAANPDPEVKERYFTDYLRKDGPPEQWVQDSLGTFHWPGQDSATLPFLRRALDRIEDVKRDRKIFFMPAWIDAFVNGHSTAEALQVVDTFLSEHPDLDPDVRSKILQSLDDLRRTVQIRKRWR